TGSPHATSNPSTTSQCEPPAGTAEADSPRAAPQGFGDDPTCPDCAGCGAPLRPRPWTGAEECHPFSVLPSNRSCHPCAFSCGVSVFVVWPNTVATNTSKVNAASGA